jgi:hypothetical protein
MSKYYDFAKKFDLASIFRVVLRLRGMQTIFELGPKWHSPIGSMPFHRAQKTLHFHARNPPISHVMYLPASKTLSTGPYKLLLYASYAEICMQIFDFMLNKYMLKQIFASE